MRRRSRRWKTPTSTRRSRRSANVTPRSSPKFEGGAEVGDYITADLTFHLEGKTYNEAKEVQFRLQPELRFQDGRRSRGSTPFWSASSPSESREADAKIGNSSADPEIRGKTIKVTFEVLDLKTLRLPEMDAEFFKTTGFRRRSRSPTKLSGACWSGGSSSRSGRRSGREILDKLVA